MNCDDPKFTAHVLGEDEDLTPAERAEIEALITSDPAAASEAAETRALAARLRADLAGEAAAGLEEAQRAAVLQAAKSAAASAKVVPFPRRNTALAAIAACLVVGVTTALVYRDLQEAPTSVALASADLPPETLTPSSGTISPPAPLSPPTRQVQFGNITLAKTTDADVSNEALQEPPIPAMPVASTNLLPGLNSIQEMSAYHFSGSIVSTTTLTLTTSMGYHSSTIVGPSTTSITAPIPAPQLGSLNLQSSGFYSGSPILTGSIGATSANEQPLGELARRDGASPLAMANVKDASADLQPTGAPVAAAGSVNLRREDPLPKARENPVSTADTDGSTASLDVVRHSLEANQRPPADAVQIAGLLNRFGWNYPAPQGGLPFSVTVEVNKCPWMPEHRLVRIGLRTNGDMNIQVEFNASQVDGYRLVGSERSSASDNDSQGGLQGSGAIRAGQTVTALYELVPMGKEPLTLAQLDKTKALPNRALPQQKEAEPLAEPAATAAAAPAISAPASEEKAPSKLQLEITPSPKSAGKSPQLAVPGAPPKTEAQMHPDIAQLLAPASTNIPQPIPAPPAGAAELLPPAAPQAKPEPLPPVAPLAGQPYLVEEKRRAEGAMPFGYMARANQKGGGRELFTLKLRYKARDGQTDKLLPFPVGDSGKSWEKSSPDFRFAAAVAGFGMLLRDSPDRGQASWEAVAQWAREGLGTDANGERRQFLELIEKARSLSP